jgi:peptide/nickel transport system substrate-binding protein
LNEPDPDFLFKLAFLFTTPIPAGTPIRNLHMTPIPGTGPYRIVQANTERIKLTRNPFFREWSHTAQPDGNPDVIIWKFGLSLDAEVREIERGTADWMFDAVPGSRLHEVQTRFAGQLHANPSPQTDFFRINTQLPPFDHVEVRRALNFAIDREQIAETYGGTTVAAPTCQVLPPGVPGYVRYCPYTLAANDSGAWTAPDFAQARQLVKASNTQGAAVTVLGFTDDPSIRPSVARIVAATLRRLGYHASVRLISHAALDRLSRPERSSIQLMPGAWYADYPAASDFFGLLLSCNGTYNGHFFCNPRIDNMMRQATSLQVTDPRRSARIWAAVDRAAVDEAAWVPLVNPETFEFVSSRVHSYQHNPLWGFIADQAWLR